MNPSFPKCPGAVFSSALPMRGSSQECHNLTSYWTRERGIVHDSSLEEAEGKHPSFMKTLNQQLLTAYARVAGNTALSIQEMWMESTGFFPLKGGTQPNGKPAVRVFYRAILNSKGTASQLSDMHNRVKQDVTDHFRPSTDLLINSQLLVR